MREEIRSTCQTFFKSLLLLKWILPMFALCGLAIAQPAAPNTTFEGRKIIAIEFSSAQPLAQTDLDKAQPLRVGQPLQRSDIAHAIDGLFATGYFEDIAVEIDPSANGVTVKFLTKNAWFIGGVSIEGRLGDPPNRGETAQATRLTLGTPFHEEDVKQAAENIKHLLESNGLYEAQVMPVERQDPHAQEVFLTFQIKDGKRAKYDQPTIKTESDAKQEPDGQKEQTPQPSQNKGAALSDTSILRITGWRIPIIHWWRHVTDERTQKGVVKIRKKYQSQDRLTARVELNSLDYDAEKRRVHPSVTQNPGPKVTVQALESGVSKRVLKRYVPVFQELAVDNDLLVEGERNLRDYLQSQGYYDVDVDFRVEPLQNDVMTINYVIARGQRYKLVKLDVEGNRYFNKETIRERMFMEPASFRLRHGRYSEAFQRKDEQTIEDLYHNNGFRNVQVATVVNRTYQGKPGEVAATVQVTEGDQWLVDHLSIEGLASMPDVRARLTVTEGQPFSDANMASDRSYVLTTLYSEGYPDAKFDAKWAESGTPHHVNVVYTIDEGKRQFVREVITSGLRTTRPSLIQQYITLKPGDPLSPIAQTATQQRYYDLGVFARVDTAVQNAEGDTEQKYVLYHFEEANRYTFSVGVGAQVGRFGTPSTTSLSSPAGATGFSPQVSFTATRMNFLGLGHTVSLRTDYSNLQKRASLTYLQPRFRNIDGRNITYSVLYDNTLDVRTFAAHREEASVQMSQKFTKALNGLFQIAYRRVSVSDVVIPVLLIPQLVQPVRIGMFSANFIHDRRDNAQDAHRGIWTTASLSLATKALGSQRSFARVLVRNASYYSLTRNIVLARQTQFGVIIPFSPPEGLSAEESVPLPERFFGGGADSLRAFPYNQAGPRDIGTPVEPGGPASSPTGFPLGGNALFFNNVELRFPLIGNNIQGVVFHDMGNVYSSLSNVSFRFSQKDNQDFDYAVHAVGFGVRYKTPVGPVRFDLAYSINPPAFVGFKGTPDQLLLCNPSLPPSSLPGYCQGVPQRVSHIQFFFSIGQTF